MVTLALLLLWKTRGLEAGYRSPCPIVCPPTFHSALVTRLGSGDLDLERQEIPIPSTFERGDTLLGVLVNLGFTRREAEDLSGQLRQYVDPRRLQPGDTYSTLYHPQGTVSGIQLVSRGKGRVLARRDQEPGTDDSPWQISWHPYVRHTEVKTLSGTLEGSLEAGVRQAGGQAAVTYVMAEALQWDLDFTRDLRQGDVFRAVYEEVYLDGRLNGVGRLLAVQYENQGRLIEAYRFGDGFYDGEGRPLRKMFLRSPLRYSRVTSQFSHRRFHPVLKIYRPHYGVDYGAPVGTPVLVTAAGSVTFAGWNKGGGGKVVKVRHPNGYETAYLHLSRFAEGVRPGRHVRQGEVIGYVGATGLATAPHLDYRIKVNGKYINPLSLKSVPAEPIAQKALPEYIAWRDVLRESLVSGEIPERLEPQLAKAGESRSEGSESRTAEAQAESEDLTRPAAKRLAR